MQGIHITNEIGHLKAVLVHRPGAETQNYPDADFSQVFSLRKWSGRFDLDKAMYEHDSMVQLLEKHGVETIEIRDLLEDSLETEPQSLKYFIDDYLRCSGATGREFLEAITQLFENAKNTQELVNIVLNGIRFGDTELCSNQSETLRALVHEQFDPASLLVNPLNTLFFTRDPAVVVGGGIILNHMYWPERDREVALYRQIFTHHKIMGETPICDLNRSSYHIEGGDIIVISAKTILVGISDRTEPAAVESLAKELLTSNKFQTTELIAIRVPSDGLRIHLDTFISRIDHDAFLIDREICNAVDAYSIQLKRSGRGLTITPIDRTIPEILSAACCEPIKVIDCGGGNQTAYERERRNNATSILALSPGKLCVYEENVWTNEALEKAGMELFPLSIDELTKGYGGTNCLCLPLWREDL